MEDEEVDILGDYENYVSKTEREISNISAGQILSDFDYTVHPLWLIDNIEGGNFSDQISQQIIQEDEDKVIYASDSDEYDKPIMHWPTEVASDDNIILEDDIPASVEEEVVTNFHPEFEEHPIQDERIIPKLQQNPRSILKKNYNLNKIPCKFKQTLTIDRSLLKSNQKFVNSLTQNLTEIGTDTKIEILKAQKKDKIIKINKSENVPKFKQSVKIKFNKSDTILKKKFNLLKKKIGRTRNTKKSPNKKHKSGIIYDENITINHNDSNESSQLNDLVLKINSTKAEEDDESDVDIETEEPDSNVIKHEILLDVNKSDNTDNFIGENLEIAYEVELVQEPKMSPIKEEQPPPVICKMENIDFECSPEVRDILESLEEPTEELVLNLSEITELEKVIHSEFFENRPTKTPERYMKIRAHIISSYIAVKPNYISKTAVRNGLKNCGDVNCISRIHGLLEQIGAINFGCQGEHFNIIRPLSRLLVQPTIKQAIKSVGLVNLPVEMERRQRIKSLTDKNCTISHAVGRNDLNKKDERNKRRNEFELIDCQQFTSDNNVPFKVSITLSTLLCLQLHSLSSKYEVMGFLGGYRSQSIGKNKLSLVRYKPCKTTTQSGTMCEMCPVSQVEQSSILISEGYDLLGWFHSHPLFPPKPSRTDVKTQAEMQIQFSHENHTPFIGFILGCVDMQYNCIYVMPKTIQKNNWNKFDITTTNGDDRIPYQIPVDIIKDCTNFSNDVKDVIDIIKTEKESFHILLDKFTETANVLLKKYGFDIDVCYLLKDILYK